MGNKHVPGPSERYIISVLPSSLSHASLKRAFASFAVCYPFMVTISLEWPFIFVSFLLTVSKQSEVESKLLGH